VRHPVAWSLVMSGVVSVAVVMAYFALPLSTQRTAGGWLILTVGLVVVAALLVWHLRSIIVSPFPGVRAVAAVATTIPLFLVVFAATHFLLARNDPGAFSEKLSRLDALYFSVTVFATVGFGDIVPTSSTARALTTVQMVGDVIILAFVAQVIVGAVRQGLRRRAAESGSEETPDDPS
jgi:voltage-gated potassium channel